MKIAKILLTTALLGSVVAPAAYAKGNDHQSATGTWSNVDPNPGLATVIPEQPVQAWEVAPDGTKTYITPLDKLPKKTETTSGGISPDSFTDSSGFYYEYDHYDPNYNAEDDYHFFAGSSSLANYSDHSVNFTYTQQQTTTNTWTFTGKVSYEAGLKVAVLANAKFSVGFDVSDQRINSQGSTYGFSTTVSAYKKGTISVYNAGGYSSGAGAWRKYSPSGTSLLGMYYETTSAWGVADNQVNMKYSETSL